MSTVTIRILAKVAQATDQKEAAFIGAQIATAPTKFMAKVKNAGASE